MAYVFQVGFDIRRDEAGELALGGTLERVLSYLRVRLPGEPGFVMARALSSVDATPTVHVIAESTWETWEDLEQHRQTAMVEEKVLLEFDSHVSLEHLDTRVYEEVA
jgi:hypothetical protein